MKCDQKECPWNNDGVCEEPVGMEIDGSEDCAERGREYWIKNI